MKNLRQLIRIGGTLCSLSIVGAIATTGQAQSRPLSEPNVKLNVQRTSGNCPATVGLWWFILPYEGGAEHTVVADTRAFADTAKLIVSNNKRFVEFVSPLRSEYAACVGQTKEQEYSFYNVEFKNKKAFFRVDLRKINAPDRLIIYKTIAGSRPYVRWAIAD